jgi:hypothetical protein
MALSENFGSEVSWIWPRALGETENCYVHFYQAFQVEAVDPGAVLSINGAAACAIWLNGHFVNTMQFADLSEERTYVEIEISDYLRAGRNVLCVLAYDQGRSTFRYLKKAPGLIYQVSNGSERLGSGTDCFYRLAPDYRSGTLPLITPQLGFCFEYDARCCDDWNRDKAYRPGGEWCQIGDEDLCDDLGGVTLHPAPIRLVSRERVEAKCIAQGVFMRKATAGQKPSPAQLIQTDYLSARRYREVFCEDRITLKPDMVAGHDGIYLVYDLGREEAGVLSLDLEADADTVLEIGYGEHLEDLRVRAHVGGRHFASRYICREGRQRFTHYCSRWGGRYLQLHISGMTTQFRVHHASLIPQEYPVEVKGSFECPDQLRNRIYATSIRTLHLCMHEHYEDTPWREQALYANDSRNQALCGYYCFGDYAYPAACFTLLGKTLREDGFLEICAPAESDITIPSFSIVWILAAADHLRFSGDTDTAALYLDMIERKLDTLLSRLSDGLLPTPLEKAYWNFYDWKPGLDGQLEMPDDQAAYDAPLNLFLALALEATISMSKHCGRTANIHRYQDALARLKASFQQVFWDEQSAAYLTRSGVSHVAELTQALAILARICPEDMAESLRERLAATNSPWVPTSLSQSFYKYEALLTAPGRYGKQVFAMLDQQWNPMLLDGATSFWETEEGAADFEDAGSMCHGWSAIPVYFYQSRLLGVKPGSPGFRTFSVNPILDVVASAAGTVPTPFGPISVRWHREGSKTIVDITHPKEVSLCESPFSVGDEIRVTTTVVSKVS